MRTLRLLEQHHKKLSDLLRFPTENPVNTSTTEPEVHASEEKPLSTSAAVAELRTSKSDLGPRASNPRTPPSLSTPRRLPPRDLSSSIASNLASARGIRAKHSRQPLSPSVSSLQAPGNVESKARKESRRSKLPASIPEHAPPRPVFVPPQSGQNKAEAQTLTSKASAIAEQPIAIPTANEEGFRKFYNAFGSYLSKISAPLAFAGLPLISEDTATPAIAEPNTRRTRVEVKERADAEPDLAKFISRAALRASTRDGHAGNDSFYVVPTTGHTASYAQILSFAEKEKRRLAAAAHAENPDLFSDPNDEDDFVDARETPMPQSPSLQKTAKPKLSVHKLENRIEEVVTENRALKTSIDKLSKRLSLFEMSSQKSGSMLQESVRLMRTASPAREPSFGNAGGLNPGDEALRRRIMELEEQALMSDKEKERLGKEIEKLKSVVSRYRDRWEKLKEGAKTRREAGSGKDGPVKEESLKDSPPKKEASRERFLAG